MMKPLMGFGVLHESAGEYERDREQREQGNKGKWQDFPREEAFACRIVYIYLQIILLKTSPFALGLKYYYYTFMDTIWNFLFLSIYQEYVVFMIGCNNNIFNSIQYVKGNIVDTISTYIFHYFVPYFLCSFSSFCYLPKWRSWFLLLNLLLGPWPRNHFQGAFL